MANEPGFTPVGTAQSTPGFTPVNAPVNATPPGQQPYQSQSTDEVMPMDVAQRHAKSRTGGPRPDERGAGEKALDWARNTFVGKAAGAAGGEATNLAGGMYELGKSAMPQSVSEGAAMLSPMPMPNGRDWRVFQQAFLEPTKQKIQSAKEAPDTTGTMLGYAGVLNPLSPDIAKLYETASEDPAEAIGQGGMDIFALAATDPVLREKLTGIRRIAEQAPAVKSGYIGLSKSVQNAAHVAENNLTGPDGAVGRHATAVIEQSAQDAKMKGLPGEVSTTDAQAAGQKQAEAVRRPDMIASHPPYYTMAEAKDTLGKIGKAAIKFENAGKAPEASVLWAEYDKLRQATQARADALGGTFGQSWKYYSSEFHNYMQVRKGLLGDILDAQTTDEHMAAMKKMTGGEGPGAKPEASAVHPDVPRMKQWLKTYGADPKLLDSAVEQGQQLNKLTQQSKNIFISKIRGIANHPVIAGSAGVAAYGAAGLSGIPMAHYIVPLLVVGRIAGLLDAADAVRLVRSITKRVGEENMHGIPAPQGEPPMPTGGESELERLRRNLSAPTEEMSADVPGGETELERIRRNPPAPVEPMSLEEQRQADQRKGTPIVPAEDTAKRAEQMKAARTVYKGRRGGTR